MAPPTDAREWILAVGITALGAGALSGCQSPARPEGGDDAGRFDGSAADSSTGDATTRVDAALEGGGAEASSPESGTAPDAGVDAFASPDGGALDGGVDSAGPSGADGATDAPSTASADAGDSGAVANAGDSGAVTDAADAGPPATVIVGPSGSSAVVPAGAVDAGTALAIAVADGGSPAMFANVETASAIYTFMPSGITFGAPVAITVPFTPALDAGTATLYTAEPDGGWTAVQGAVVAGDTMQAAVLHFSNYVVGYASPGWVAAGGIVPHNGSSNAVVECGGNVVAFALDAGVYETPWFGSSSWYAFDDGLPATASVRWLSADATTVYAVTSAGVYKAPLGVAPWTWSSINGTLPASVVTVASNGSSLFAGTAGAGTRMYVSSNGGSSWSTSDTGLNEGASYGTTGTWVVDGTAFTTNAGSLYYSTNDGASWSLSTVGDGSLINAVAFCDNTWFAGLGDGLFSATTLTGTWAHSTVVPGITADGPNTSVDSLLCVGARLYIGMAESGVAYTDNAGATFTPFRTGFSQSLNGLYPDVIWLANVNGELMAATSETWLTPSAYIYAAFAPP